jgi:hypothetical protein
MSFEDTLCLRNKRCVDRELGGGVAVSLFGVQREPPQPVSLNMPPKEVPQKKGKRQPQGTGRSTGSASAKPVKKVKVANPLFQAKPKNWRIGGDLRV